MDGIYLIALVILAGVGIPLFRRSRQARTTLTQHTLQCPQYGDRASLTVRTDSAAGSERHLDVVTCSLLGSTPCAPPARMAYLPDVPGAAPYPYEVSSTPAHADRVRCPKQCLPVLNASERPGAAEPIRCTSGMSDALELARQTQPPAVVRALWYHSN